MKNLTLLLLFAVFLIGCGADDDFEDYREETFLPYVHPLEIAPGNKQPIALAEIKEKTHTPERISMPITNELRQLLFTPADELLDEIIAIEREEDEITLPVEGFLKTLQAISIIYPQETLTKSEYDFYNLLRKWKEREAQETYYTRYINAGGVIILGSDDVTESEFRIARGIILSMTSKRPVLRERLNYQREMPNFPGQHFRMVIIPENETLADIPEWIGYSSSFVPHGICGSFCASPTKWEWGGFVHEFGHAIDYAIYETNSNFRSRIQLLYETAMAAGKYEGTYAATNALEYWAEGVKHWFLPWHFQENGTRQDLINYDPELYELLAEWLPKTELVLE